MIASPSRSFALSPPTIAPAEFSTTIVFVRVTLVGVSFTPFIEKVRFCAAVVLTPSDRATAKMSTARSPDPRACTAVAALFNEYV